MLRLAMFRLKIPLSFVTLICSLFQQRKNHIITPQGLCSPYNVMIGIDQGEIISPLLWIIYYDPLFCKLKNMESQFAISNTHLTSIDPKETIHTQLLINLLAYLDDTTMIGFSHTNLKEILTIADSFYRLNNIKNNKHKSTLITNNPSITQSTLIRYGNEDIDIKITLPSESVRFLGIWFNLLGKRTFNLTKLKSITSATALMLNRKILTHDHLKYIINRVIFPKLEYLMTNIICSESECNSIMAPLRILCKTKSGLER